MSASGDDQVPYWAAPDPYIPFKTRGEGAPRQRDRQAEILANARRLIALRNFHSFSVKELARDCDLSTQSIHARLGDKLSIITTAINDYTNSIHASTLHEPHAFARLLLFVSLITESCRTQPHFLLNASSHALSDSLGQVVFRNTQAFGSIVFQRLLNDMRRQGLLDERSDVKLVADSMNIILSNTIGEWARDDRRGSDLHMTVHRRIHTITLGAIDAEHADRIRLMFQHHVEKRRPSLN